jgi:ABC-type glycerol-3-phosphate transport system permease component
MKANARFLQNRKNQDFISKTLAYIVLLILMIPFITPLLWLVSTALKTRQQVYVSPPIWIPNPIAWSNFPEALSVAPFGLFLRNTMITTLIPMAGEIFVSAMVAYSFTRVRWPWRDKIFGIVLAVMLIPGIVTFIPTFILYSKLGWVNTFMPFIVPAFFGVPIYIFIFRQFMLTMPKELDDAARVDGASTFQIFIRVILPNLGASMATVAILSFMAHWNDFFAPMIYLQRPHLKTLILGLAFFESAMTGTGGGYNLLVTSRIHLMMAITLLIDLPCILLFIFFQKYFVRSVVTTGLKG